MVIIPLPISPPVGLIVGSNPTSFAYAFPNKGVYQIKPRIKLATMATDTATKFIFIASIVVVFLV